MAVKSVSKNMQNLIDAIALERAHEIRQLSPDLSSKIGAVIVDKEGKILSDGCNDFPANVEISEERLSRPLKYSYTEHAERNAIYKAAKNGISLEGATLYLVGMGPPTVPCTECARAIVQSGIKKVFGRSYKPLPAHWEDSLRIASEILKEAGVEFEEI